MSLSLEQAKAVIAATFEFAHDKGMAPLAVLVLDAGGNITAFEREDGASNLRFQVAYGKSYGALGMGVGSRSLGEAAVARPHFAAGLNGAFGGAMIPVPGGVLVKDESGRVLGAVGVSGDKSDNDEAAAMAGITSVGLVPVP